MKNRKAYAIICWIVAAMAFLAALLISEGKIENVRVVGPSRSYNQVEVSASDARKLGIKPPVRKSGVLDGASLITIKT